MVDPDLNRDVRGPGVIVPPPVIYLAFFLAGIALGWAFPLPSFESRAALFIGWLIALASLVIAVLGFKEFRTAQTTFRPDRSASSLITTGIIKFSRNPLYLSLFLLYSEISILIGAWWPIILLPLLFTVMDRYVVAREERYLAQRFGASYSVYCKRVRRWL